MSHIYFQPHLLNFTFLSFSVNGSKEADGDGEGDKTDAQGNNSTTKVKYTFILSKCTATNCIFHSIHY